LAYRLTGDDRWINRTILNFIQPRAVQSFADTTILHVTPAQLRSSRRDIEGHLVPIGGCTDCTRDTVRVNTVDVKTHSIPQGLRGCFPPEFDSTRPIDPGLQPNPLLIQNSTAASGSTSGISADGFDLPLAISACGPTFVPRLAGCLQGLGEWTSREKVQIGVGADVTSAGIVHHCGIGSDVSRLHVGDDQVAIGAANNPVYVGEVCAIESPEIIERPSTGGFHIEGSRSAGFGDQAHRRIDDDRCRRAELNLIQPGTILAVGTAVILRIGPFQYLSDIRQFKRSPTPIQFAGNIGFFNPVHIKAQPVAVGLRRNLPPETNSPLADDSGFDPVGLAIGQGTALSGVQPIIGFVVLASPG